MITLILLLLASPARADSYDNYVAIHSLEQKLDECNKRSEELLTETRDLHREFSSFVAAQTDPWTGKLRSKKLKNDQNR